LSDRFSVESALRLPDDKPVRTTWQLELQPFNVHDWAPKMLMGHVTWPRPSRVGLSSVD